MPPTMSHRDSTARAERAWKLHLRGRSWQEVADAEGFQSRTSARKAVIKWLQRNPSDDIEQLRRATGDTLTLVIHRVMDSLDAAQAKGDHRGVAELGRVVMDGLDKRAKLQGLHIAVPQLVEVNVQTMAEILTDTRARLMQAVDAEIVDLPPENTAEAPELPEAGFRSLTVETCNQESSSPIDYEPAERNEP